MIYRGKSGKAYNLETKCFSAGGEGEIYNIIGRSNEVAKIYKPGKISAEKEAELLKMVNTPLDTSISTQVAWPKDLLYNNGKFVGFVMPKMKVNETLNVIYEYGSSAKYGNLEWENRIMIAKNLCVVLYKIHSSGHTCGDLNAKNNSF